MTNEAGSSERLEFPLSGPARGHWEHSLPPVEALRYSITFRTP